MDTLCGQILRDHVGSPLACFITVQTDVHLFQVGLFLQSLPQHPVADTAAGGVAVIPPAGGMQGEERKQVDGGFEQEQGIVRPDPVEAVFRSAAGSVSLEAPSGGSAVFMQVPHLPLGIIAHEHGVVVVSRLIHKSAVHEVIQHLLGDLPLAAQVGIDSAHIVVLRWDLQRLVFKGNHCFPDRWSTQSEQGFD